jgi:hypothetical protein
MVAAVFGAAYDQSQELCDLFPSLSPGTPAAGKDSFFYFARFPCSFAIIFLNLQQKNHQTPEKTLVESVATG